MYLQGIKFLNDNPWNDKDRPGNTYRGTRHTCTHRLALANYIVHNIHGQSVRMGGAL